MSDCLLAPLSSKTREQQRRGRVCLSRGVDALARMAARGGEEDGVGIDDSTTHAVRRRRREGGGTWENVSSGCLRGRKGG